MSQEFTRHTGARDVETEGRTTWLRVMYAANCAFALFGLAVILIPATMRSVLGVTATDPIHFGIAAGAVPFAFGVLSLFGLRAPVKFSPVLGLQVLYKGMFLLGIVLPLALAGELPGFAVPLAGLFVLFIAGDLFAIPFPYLLSAEGAGLDRA